MMRLRGRVGRWLRPAPGQTQTRFGTGLGNGIRRAIRGGLALGLVATALAAACGSGASPSPTAQVAVGLVTSIDASSPTDVRSFTLRTDDGATMTFAIGSGTNTGFPPGHLQEHRASGEKVEVTYHVDAGKNVVDGLGDAESPSGSPGAS